MADAGSTSSGDQLPGWQGPTDANNDFNAHSFIAKQMQGRQATIKMVKITSVDGGHGAIGKAGAVDIEPLTNQTDGAGGSQEHGTVYGLLYIRIQGGKNAIIMDPSVGDTGLALVCDRDISGNKANPGQRANPGSMRRFSLSDGVYIGGCNNDKPSSIVRWEDDGSVLLQPIVDDALAPAAKWDNTDKKLYLGGEPPTLVPKVKFSPVLTVAGPSINVLARFTP